MEARWEPLGPYVLPPAASALLAAALASAFGKQLFVCTDLSLPAVLVAGAAHLYSLSCFTFHSSEAMPSWLRASEKGRGLPSPISWFTTYPQVIISGNIHSFPADRETKRQSENQEEGPYQELNLRGDICYSN